MNVRHRMLLVSMGLVLIGAVAAVAFVLSSREADPVATRRSPTWTPTIPPKVDRCAKAILVLGRLSRRWGAIWDRARVQFNGASTAEEKGRIFSEAAEDMAALEDRVKEEGYAVVAQQRKARDLLEEAAAKASSSFEKLAAGWVNGDRETARAGASGMAESERLARVANSTLFRVRC